MDARKETLSDTDEPSLESRVTDNLMVVPWSLKGVEFAIIVAEAIGNRSGIVRCQLDHKELLV